MKGGFILVRTNLCPFITVHPGKKQVKVNPKRKVKLEGGTDLLSQCSTDGYLDELFETLDGAVTFGSVTGRSRQPSGCGLPAGSLSGVTGSGSGCSPRTSTPQTHLYLDGTFRKPAHPLHPLFA
jgi:hypothetical protein